MRIKRMLFSKLRELSFRTCIALFVISVLLWGEWLSYKLKASDWPELSPESSSTKYLKLLLVADPQLIGYQDEPFGVGWIARWDSDRYLCRTFSYVHAHVQPDLVIFLGDLLDEGTKATVPQYEHYVHRFYDVFHQIKKNVVIYLSGDNDIGGEAGELVTDFNKNRFAAAFDTDTALKNVIFDFANFIEYNHFDEGKRKYLTRVDAKNVRDMVNILLSHTPVIYTVNADEIVAALQPSLVISAHTHKAYVSRRNNWAADSHTVQKRINPSDEPIKFELSSGQLTELQIPTCSYRMGVPNMGYGYIILEQKDAEGVEAQFTVLWLPARYPQLYTYAIACLFVVLLTVLRLMCLKLGFISSSRKVMK